MHNVRFAAFQQRQDLKRGNDNGIYKIGYLPVWSVCAD